MHHDSQPSKTEEYYQSWIHRLEADLVTAREEMVQLTDEKLSLDDELMIVRAQRRKLKAELAEIDCKFKEQTVQFQDLQLVAEAAQKQLRRLHDNAQDEPKTIEAFAKRMESLRSTLEQERALRASLEAEVKELHRTNDELRGHFEALEKETAGLRFRPQSVEVSSSESTKAMQNLALIILSKDKRGPIDPKTRQFSDQIFGDNFGHLVETYESKLKEAKDDNKALRDKMREEAYELLERVGELQASMDLLIQIDKLLKQGSHVAASDLVSRYSSADFIQQKSELENLIAEAQSTFAIAERQSLKSRADLFRPSSASFSVVSDDQEMIGRLKAKLNAKADEHAKILERLKASQAAEAETRMQLETWTACGGIGLAANSADLLGFIQVGAAAVEGLLHEQAHSFKAVSGRRLHR
jgi:chromosome segregation ATPase